MAYVRSAGNFAGGVTSITAASFDTSTTNGLLVITVGDYSGGNNVTSVTVDGNAATLNDKDTFHVGANAVYQYYYPVGSGVGTIDITANRSSSTGGIGICVELLSDMAQTSPLDASAKATVAAGNSSVSDSVTTIEDNDWVVVSGGGQAALAATAGATLRNTQASDQIVIGDSAAAISPAGSHTVTLSITPSQTAALVLGAYKPAVSVNTTDFFNMM